MAGPFEVGPGGGEVGPGGDELGTGATPVASVTLDIAVDQAAATTFPTGSRRATGQIGTVWSQPGNLDLASPGPVPPLLPTIQPVADISIVIVEANLLAIDVTQAAASTFVQTPIHYTGQLGTVNSQPGLIDPSVLGPLPHVFTGDRDSLALDVTQAAASIDIELLVATLVIPGEILIAGEPVLVGAAFAVAGEVQIAGLSPSLSYGWTDPPVRVPIGAPGGPPSDPSDPTSPGTGPPSAHGPSTHIELIYDNSENILPDVLYEDAEFKTSVNGEPGPCFFRLRIHPGKPRTLVTGKRLQLKIKGVPEWDGYITSATRAFFLKKEPTRQAVHYLRVEGIDVNILFRKRYTLDPEVNARTQGPTYVFDDVGQVQDVDALRDLFKWLDLAGDNLDLESKLEPVGPINIDSDTNPWQASWTWEQAMVELAKLPANIWGIDPDRALYWRDVSTLASVDAPFPMDDDPGPHPATPTAPYREVEILQDGSDLITDVMVWGAGTGSQKMKFQRYQSDPQDHGLWQHAEKSYVTFSQPSVNKIAYSWIFGSPFNKRGHRLEKVTVKVVTFVNGYRSGQMVDFRCRALDFFDRIPIRDLVITFPEPYLPKYEITMSHEIDAPWGITDVLGITEPVVKEFPTEEYGFGCLFTPCRTGWTVGGVLVFTDYFDPQLPGWTSTTTPSLIAGPPWCVTIVSRPSGSVVLRILGGYVTVNRNDTAHTVTISAHVVDQPGWLEATSTVTFPQPSGTTTDQFELKMQVLPGMVRAKWWLAKGREPKDWRVTAGPSVDISVNAELQQAVDFNPGSAFAGSGVPQLQLYMPSGLSELVADGDGIAVAGGEGNRWAWFMSGTSSVIYHADHGYTLIYYPGGYPVPGSYPMVTHPGGYPANGEGEPLDLFLHFNGGPDTGPSAAPQGGNIFRSENYAIAGGPSDGTVIYGRTWGWDMIIGFPPSGAGSGIVGSETYSLRGFTPPLGAVSARLQAFVYCNNAGESLGEPDPGEGAINFEVWLTQYGGSGSVGIGGIAHQVIASGSVPGYNLAPSATGVGVPIDVEIPVVEGSTFEITGKITDSISSWAGIHGPHSGFPLAGGRSMALNLKDIRLYWSHVPIPGGQIRPCHGTGEQKETIHCGENPITLKRQYLKGSTKIWIGGLYQQMNVDYIETDPSKGIISFTHTPDCEDAIVIHYRALTVDGRSGLPPKLRKIRG